MEQGYKLCCIIRPPKSCVQSSFDLGRRGLAFVGESYIHLLSFDSLNIYFRHWLFHVFVHESVRIPIPGQYLAYFVKL